MHASVAHTQAEIQQTNTHKCIFYNIYLHWRWRRSRRRRRSRAPPFVLFTTDIFASLLLLLLLLLVLLLSLVCVLSFAFVFVSHTHFVLFATSLSLSLSCLALSLPLCQCVCVCVCLPSCFSTRFLLFIFTYIYFSSSSYSSLSSSSSVYALSCGLQILEILFFIFFSLPHTLFQREKRVFPDVDFACILLLACLQLGMRVPLEFVEKSNENKRRAALSHICDLCLSLSYLWIQFVWMTLWRWCLSVSETQRGNDVVVCSCFSGKTRQARNNNNNNYKALNVQ